MKEKAKNIISLILRLVVVVFAAVGVYFEVNKASGVCLNAFLYFTIQSNIWICIVCLIGVIGRIFKLKPGHALSVLKLMFTIAITLTGVVFCSMLAPLIGPGAFSFSSTCVHVVAPLAAVLDFIVSRKDYELSKCDAWWVLLPPVYYICFAAVGFVLNWDFDGLGHNYPYFFLDWGSPAGAFGFTAEFPFIGTMWYITIVLAILYGLGRLLIRSAK